MSGDFQWSNATNWNNGLPTNGNNATIGAVDSVYYALTANTTVDFDIANSGKLSIELSDYTLALQASLMNVGDLAISTSGFGAVQNNGTLDNASSFTLDAGLTNTTQGILANGGELTSSLLITNANIIVNMPTGMLISNGTLSNTSELTNNGVINNNGEFSNNTGGQVLNNGMLTNEGSLSNLAILGNDGTIINNNTISTQGDFNNMPTAVLINNATFTNQTNLLNEASIENALCAKFFAADGSTATNINGGAFTNNGIAYEILTGSVAITDGTGVVLNDPFENPIPNAVCMNISIALPASGTATLSATDIDGGSNAPYCEIATLAASQTEFTCADAGENTVILLVIDNNGAAASCEAIVTVTESQAPSIFCPAPIVVDLAGGECGAEVIFSQSLSATDDCSTPTIAQIDNTGLTSGDIFPIDTTTLTFEATDGSGNTADCSFDIIVNEFEPVADALFCNDNLNISLDASCELALGADMLLEGDDYHCYDFYNIEVDQTGSNMVTYDMVGETIMFMVTNPETGNSCWGQALIEDKLPPAVMNCENDTLNCFQNELPISEGGDAIIPSFEDCSDITVTYEDAVEEGECADGFAQRITRTWTATDAMGFASICEQIILVNRISLTDITPNCPDTYNFECNAGATLNFDPATTGIPSITVEGETYSLDLDNMVCGLMLSMEDDTLDKCGPTFTIMRRWQVIDWCTPMTTNGDNPWLCFQEINYTDTTAPEVMNPDPITVSTNDDDCLATTELPPLEIMDCSEVEVVIVTPLGNINANGGELPAPGLTVGTYDLEYYITDACGNLSVTTIQLIIEDNTPPTPVCDGITEVTLTSDGLGILYASSVDNGSTDNCCLQYVEIRRLTDPCGISGIDFANTITFCCEDVGDTVTVELRAMDCYGNSNTCEVLVVVDDKIDPTLTCPPDITLACGADITDLTVAGEPIITDNCEAPSAEYTDLGALTCAGGTIFRTFSIPVNAGYETCIQKITIENGAPLVCADIQFPANYTGNGCDADTSPAVAGEPEVMTGSVCGDVLITFDDLPVAGLGYCLKILRTWTVIDDCVYDPVTNPDEGICTYTQTILVEADDVPTISSCLNRTFCNFSNDCAPELVDLSIEVSDACTDAADLDISWIVDANNDGVADGAAFEGTGMNSSNAYPVGEHAITYNVTNECGASSECSFVFYVVDCKKPTIVCKTGLATDILSNGEVTIDAASLISGNTTDNCSAFQDLTFSFSEDMTQPMLTLTCSDLGEIDIEVWGADEAGNQDFCIATIIVQDTGSACGSSFAIAGAITTENDDAVEEIMVEISGFTNASNMTNDDGDFYVNSLTSANDYTVAPYNNTDLTNGVTTYDIVVLGKHILNVEPLDSPYKRIAADVNNSGSITSADMVAMRAVILHLADEFPNNNSWRFVPNDYQFSTPQNPFADEFPEIINVNNLSQDEMHNDFVGIKIGDLNGSAITNASMTTDRTTHGEFYLNVENQALDAFQQVHIPVKAKDLSNIIGFQFTLAVNPFLGSLLDVVPGAMAAEHLGKRFLEDDKLLVSWNSEEPLSEDVLFTLVVETNTETSIAQLLSVNSSMLRAEAYQHNGDLMAVRLAISDDATATSTAFELYQNRPNPFNNTTIISFNLPAQTATQLNIYSLSGQLIQTYTISGHEGYNEFEIRESDLKVAGVYYFEINTPSHNAKKKMVLTK